MSQHQSLIDAALAEDIGTGDVTTLALIPADAQATLQLVAKQAVSVAGLDVAAQVFRTLDPNVRITPQRQDGDAVRAGTVLMIVEGSARALLTAERVALNLLQRMCGVATLTSQYVKAVEGTKAAILDTRKTMPGMRLLDKYAVRCGGGVNHRVGLFDAVMIKDNHIAICGGIAGAVAKVRGSGLPVIVECDTLAQVREALDAKPDRILLDNMTPLQLRDAVVVAGGHIPLEASGNVSLENVREIAETGVDFISIGKLTHSAPAADIGADVIID